MKKEERTYRLDRSVVGEGVLSELASDTGLLVASEGNLGVELVVAVAARTKLISLRLNEEEGRGTYTQTVPALRALAVLRARLMSRENTAAARPYMVSLALWRMSASSLKRLTTTTGPKISSLTMRISGVTSVCDQETESVTMIEKGKRGTHEDGRLDEVSLGSVALSSKVNGGSLLLARLDVGHDSVVLELRGLRSLEGGSVEGVSDLERLHLLGEEGEELVVDAVLDVDAGSGAAALAVVEEESEGGPRNGLLKVGVVENDVGRLSSELESDVLEVGGGGSLHDDTTDEGGSGEGELRYGMVSCGARRSARGTTHLLNLHVRGDGGSGDGSESGNDVDYTRREDLGDEAGNEKGREGGLLGGLEDWRAKGSARVRSVVATRDLPTQLPVASAGPIFQQNMRMG